ncbi:hypothetical protein KCU99_g288, partial [Aureobasidium melanogenum]
MLTIEQMIGCDEQDAILSAVVSGLESPLSLRRWQHIRMKGEEPAAKGRPEPHARRGRIYVELFFSLDGKRTQIVMATKEQRKRGRKGLCFRGNQSLIACMQEIPLCWSCGDRDPMNCPPPLSVLKWLKIEVHLHTGSLHAQLILQENVFFPSSF